MDIEHIVFLLVGVVVVFVVGRLMVQSGRRYIAHGQPASRSVASAANLVAVLFHLITLGLVALLGVLPLGGPPEQRFLLRLGLLLIVVAGVYGITLTLLNRRREEALVAEFSANSAQREAEEVAAEQSGAQQHHPEIREAGQ